MDSQSSKNTNDGPFSQTPLLLSRNDSSIAAEDVFLECYYLFVQWNPGLKKPSISGSSIGCFNMYMEALYTY